ncbi:MAG TPA: nitrate/nitrite transporter NrtS [Jatrophihabitantaceae bacterium]|nr:nitrate/nitrite transporter NrtS [Jatrophihabitantaceae bacterium]
MTGSVEVTWSTPRQALRVVGQWSHLCRTTATALIVGTVLFAINHMDTVLSGAATTGTWVKVGITYLVPFAVANIGLLLGSHRPRAGRDGGEIES